MMIPDDSIFAAKVKDILNEAGWIRDVSRSYAYTPSAALAGWKGMIAACKKGYQENIYEYDNDLAVRVMIELLLASEILKEYPEFQEFSETVKSLDAEFSELLQKDVKRSAFQYWWQQGVPKYAGKELADDFFRNYEIKVQVV